MSSRTYMGAFLYEEWDDDTRTYRQWDPDTKELMVDRPYTEDENVFADETVSDDARLTDIVARLEALEAFVYGTPEEPVDNSDVKTWAEWDGFVPPNQFIRSATGKIYKNVSGVPLTTSIDDFPGSPGQWAHLWQEVSAPAPVEPKPPTSETPQWTEGVSYAVGNEVIFNGTRYRCIQAHTSLAGWTPAAVPALWSTA